MIDLQQLRESFKQRFGSRPRLFSAPGRVNWIGEHTDYNDGFVLPMAVESRTYVAAAPRSDRKLVAHSLNFDSRIEVDLDQPGPRRRGTWDDYIEGTARALLGRGIPIQGADLLIESDVPVGAGLSASAALELSVGYALAVLGGTEQPDRIALALAGQEAEHTYVGTLCGIMDQYVSALARADHALLIDCRTLEPTFVPMQLKTAELVVCDTRVRHQLSSSAYNVRRQECQEAVALLSSALPGIRALRDVSTADFATHGQRLPPTLFRRCRHVVSENARTLSAVTAFANGNLAALGDLMTASHLSLRDDYAVSCPELDVAVETALSIAGVYGSRLTGGGFGGCTVTLCERSAREQLVSKIEQALLDQFGAKPTLFATRGCEGVRAESGL